MSDYWNPTCYFCGARMCWQSDFDYADVYAEGDGIVSYWSCLNCGAEAEFSRKEEQEEES